MTFPVALKQLREELHLKQKELAALLEIDAVTVNRWERGKNIPKRAVAVRLLAFAKKKSVSKVCQDNLHSTLFPKPDVEDKINDLRYAEIAVINTVVNESVNGVVVLDQENFRILYANNTIAKMAGFSIEAAKDMKCYQFLMHRETPCPFCHEKQTQKNNSQDVEYASVFSGRHYRICEKEIKWAGKPARLKYIVDTTEIYQLREEVRNRSQELQQIKKIPQTEKEKHYEITYHPYCG